MNIAVYTVEQLLGVLNEVERRYSPKELYISGDVGIMSSGARVSIVGSRKVSESGARRSAKLAGILAERGIVVVSGLAAGVEPPARPAFRSSLFLVSFGGRATIRFNRKAFVVSQTPIAIPATFPQRARPKCDLIRWAQFCSTRHHRRDPRLEVHALLPGQAKRRR